MSKSLVRPILLFTIFALVSGTVCTAVPAASAAKDTKKSRAKQNNSTQPGNSGNATDASQENLVTDEIKSKAKLYEKAFDDGDAKTIASMWVDNGTYTGPDGIEYVGRDNIEQAFTRFFKAFGTPPIALELKSIRPIGDSAVEERGVASVRGQDGKPLPGTFYTAIHVKDNGEWRLASVTERGPVNARVPLKSLEWLIGDWKASGTSGQSSLSTKWEGDQHFLVSKFSSKSTTGKQNNDIQIIGTDPITGKIISWVFDSEGGTGTGRWWRVGDHWMADMNKIEADGTRFTATDIIAPSGPNSFTWQSTNRRIDGLPTASTEKVTVDRIK